MTFAEYRALPAAKQKQYQTERTCECGEKLVGVNGHSAGTLHVMCPTCEVCPDCDDGE